MVKVYFCYFVMFLPAQKKQNKVKPWLKLQHFWKTNNLIFYMIKLIGGLWALDISYTPNLAELPLLYPKWAQLQITPKHNITSSCFENTDIMLLWYRFSAFKSMYITMVEWVKIKKFGAALQFICGVLELKTQDHRTLHFWISKLWSWTETQYLTIPGW